MKYSKFIFLLLLVVLAIYTVQWHPTTNALAPFFETLVYLKSIYNEDPVLTIIVFCLIHLASSFFGIPGACTLLNILSGALFGVLLGSGIVYPLTLLSAGLGYCLGQKAANTSLLKRYSNQLLFLKQKVRNPGYTFFVSLRLSPFLPFGILNILLGILKIPFKFFLLTTSVGIFFDVVLLNSVGATLFAVDSSYKWAIFTFFIMLLISVALIDSFLLKSWETHLDHKD